ncbi:histidine--tRNA ligase [Candidatus Kaiserbacteria bacterium RIFCSPHIGHO2_01_FULL_46_22]|uniref:Histidine--tRNA ligase n=1 Tax=Candidatus Kaiserbacteria bacterium RIFCSPHIGHO2_01_FULL_46_22 TaxID=1798475 RepID=A0A1F6BYQ7_9BACT|nr:MAG: histidine--tRNA ligase [Candidatus Kaiserbacteria bacterium RIFCSPHIGHO2_01_FULL_46_22]
MKHLPTDPYKGVRDFYPEDMAVQQHIFNTWSRTAESFGFERYDASVLESSELYKSKGAANEEMVNEQTYTFTDRGDREVTLRPEMTPSVARMIAGKSKELAFPVRWYSIPNLFRYERTQRGRVREHWQLNCDIFGSTEVVTDVEIIALAYQTIINFGARPEMFEIRVNDRREMKDFYASLGVIDEESVAKVTRLNDRFHKIDRSDYLSELRLIVPGAADAILDHLEESSQSGNEVTRALNAIGINNVKVDRSLARGFDYYTGTIFEFFDTDPENNRSMLGGGRYDNLTELFGGESISGVGFGMGDVTMRDFLETHDLLPSKKAGALVIVIPTEAEFNIDGEKAAMRLRAVGASTLVDISTKKLGKKVAAADHSGAGYILVVGEDEVARGEYVLKNLADGTEMSGTLEDLAQRLAV